MSQPAKTSDTKLDPTKACATDISSSHAKLAWKDKQPFSTQYQDIYFSTENGLEETQFVFLTQNNLENRFSAVNSEIFTIIETGFGTGLNFLSTWQLWDEYAPKHSHLHFISVEKYPLTIDDLTKALTYWSTLTTYSQQLIEQYQWLKPSFNQLSFTGSNVTLSLLVGDVAESLPLLKTNADAWFLDGFSPAKNPDMWQPALFEQMARLSHQGTTFATFTSAGMVRRGLIAAGFEVMKRSGFGKKREMIHGHFVGNNSGA